VRELFVIELQVNYSKSNPKIRKLIYLRANKTNGRDGSSSPSAGILEYFVGIGIAILIPKL
jgi:hypothetical protein